MNQDPTRAAVELLPCPICKKRPNRNGRTGAGGVLCSSAHPVSHRVQIYGADQSIADAAWNDHAAPKPLGDVREAVTKARDALIEYALHYGARCRDCADEDGVCPASGLPCGGARKVIEHVVDALLYGASHGFIPASLAAPAVPDREGIARIVCRAAERRIDLRRNSELDVLADRNWKLHLSDADAILALKPGSQS